MTKEFVLTKEKPLVTAFQQLFTLPFRDQLLFNQEIRNRFRITGKQAP